MAVYTPEKPLTQADITGPGAWWCSGCGDFGVTAAFKEVLLTLVNDMKVPLEQVFIFSGIGCSSKEPEMLRVNAYHGQHGRSIPVAMGLAAANPGLVVVDFGGDGDTYAIGMEHFVHACIKNVNMTLIIMNNQVYGLTKGQASPTAHLGLKTSSTPEGKKLRPVNPLKLAIAAGAAFVARGVSWNKKELAQLMLRAIQTKGFALLDVFSPCVTYHREPGFRGSGPIVDWYRTNYVLDIRDAWREMREQVFTPEEQARLPAEYDPTSPEAATHALRLIEEAAKLGREVTGLLLINESVPTMEENLGVSKERAPALVDISVQANLKGYQELLAELR
ncbi:2-oxoglutarate oxidoreductase subunit KorB [bacterium HR25]|jgi:2-oxoglutarate ferredoxin oxidoreductase subunit beta|nr:2-oxoglutarate oxidoreductase subunit KorB [bacterium HR25]